MSKYTGSQVKQSIAANRQSIEHEIAVLDGEISSIEREIERQNKIREEALSLLAIQWLPNGEEISGKFADINSRVQKIFNGFGMAKSVG